MSSKRIAILGFCLLLFAGAFFAVLQGMGTKSYPDRQKPREALTAFSGYFTVRSIDDLWIGTTRIILCGVESNPVARTTATMTARKDFQGKTLNCRPVGMGTPCDGKIPAKYGKSVIAQCFLPDGTDVAARLVDAGLVCGLPAQAGSTYKACR
ncbi:hypothetical protein [Mesorhizobium sp. STM 4661]|uniref:hypothetical protein n=1 Tax=Mesorhizobium sp. STM 4661 TaxID=1297570 RepID=UPI0012FA50D7|nr:hypothetical protein [Mesorhizobium sp. STM 4661]